MRNITGLLVLLTAAFPAVGLAQTRIGVASGAGLATAAAPVPVLASPALQLSPSLFSSAALAPSIAAPASIPVPALASVKPAATKSENPGSDQTLAAGAALFDGAAALPAPAIGDAPFVPGSDPVDRRSSGLSPPTEAEIVAAYRAAKPRSRAVETFGRDFVATAGEAIQKYTFMGEYFLQSLNPAGRGMMDSRGWAIARAAKDLVGAHDAREDAPSRRFMQLLGRWYAFQDHAQEQVIAMKIVMMRRLGQGVPARHLTPSPIPGGEYWDMASGMNAQGFIHHELDPGTKYSFFDYSPFVVSYLKTAAELAGTPNATVIEADLNTLTRPAKPLAVLRTKNAVNYVPGFDKKLEEMAGWIAPGGQLVIQNDPTPAQRASIVEKHGPLIRRLIAEGWVFEFGFSRAPGQFGAYGLDTLILTRPLEARAKSANESTREWAAYEGEVQSLERHFNPLSFLFR